MRVEASYWLNGFAESRSAPSKNRSYAVVAVFTAVVIVCVLGGAAGVLTMLFPVLALLVGIVLFAADKPAYVGFTFWIWFLSPLVRRLADLNSGFHPGSPILMAPYLVSAISGYVLITRLRYMARPGGLPFLLAYCGIAYGIVVGLTRYPLASMLTSIADWLVPVTFGFFLYAYQEEEDKVRASVRKSFLYGALMMGLYAAYQFFFLPEWDRFWLENDHTTTFGKAEVMELRGFSTLNAPVVFALVIAAVLLVVLGASGKLRLFAGAAGFMGLVLSLNRSAWLAFTVGALFLVWRMPSRQRVHLLSVFLGCVLFSPALLAVPGVSLIVTDKLNTFTNLKQDVSYAARNEGYLRAFGQISAEPFGEGVASPILAHQTKDNDDSIGPHDSMILELLYSLGFAGTICYLGAFGLILGLSFTSNGMNAPFDSALKAVLIAYMAQGLLNEFALGPIGIMFWSVSGLLLARSAVLRKQRASRFRDTFLSQAYV